MLESKGQTSAGSDADDTIFVPFTALQKRLMGVTYLDRITLSAATPDVVAPVVGEITRVLRA